MMAWMLMSMEFEKMKFYFMITKPREQVNYPSNIGKTWAKKIQESEFNLLCYK